MDYANNEQANGYIWLRFVWDPLILLKMKFFFTESTINKGKN